MIKFLAKGLLRDRSRSFFPVFIIMITVAVVIFALGFMKGMMNTMFLDTAVIISGYEKVVTRAYNDESQMLPNDLALVDIEPMIEQLHIDYPEYFWTPKITFGGLLDIPDENNETQSQGPVIAMGIDFLSSFSRQVELWGLDKFLFSGRLPEKLDEALISTKLAKKLNVQIGQKATFIGTTMDNAFTTYNFTLVGTFNLMKGQADKQMLLVDISGAQEALVMVVLWNMGLMNGLRRYGEIGLRLAMGESKGQVYRSMISESIIIGFIGTVIGTGIGLSLTYYFQENGIDYSQVVESMNSGSMVLPNIFYSKVTQDLFYIGFFPGLLATVLGTMLAGLAIYKREMSQLFKELES